MDIVSMRLKDIKEYKFNSKIHTDEQIKHLANSIKEFGFTQPILVDNDNIILAGHGRYLAAKYLKMESIPTIVIGYLTEDQKKTYRIIDNSIALETSFELDKLIKEIRSIESVNWESFGIDKLSFEEEPEDEDNFKKKKKIVKCPHCGEEFEV